MTRIRLVRHRQTKGAETDRLGLRTREPALYSTGSNDSRSLTLPMREGLLRHPFKGVGERTWQLLPIFSISVQTEKEDPQPQVVVAFGLRMTNWAPSRPSV